MGRRECPDCERIFAGRQCPSCGWHEPEPSRSVEAPWKPPAGPPPCTPEQNLEAAQVLREVTLRLLTIEQALDRLGQIFGAQAMSEGLL